MLREAFLERTRIEVARAVKEHKAVLVVGARNTNVQDALVDSELLTLWPYEDTNCAHKPIPKHTGVVLFTRFVGHGTVNSIYKQALANGIFCTQQVMQTGEIRSVLGPLLDVVARQQPVKPVEPVPVNGTAHAAPTDVKKKAYTAPAQVARHGEIRDLVAEYADIDAKRITEAKRLMEIAKGLGITTTLDSIAQKITDLRRKRDKNKPMATVEHRGNAVVYKAEPEPGSRAATLPQSALSGNLDESVRLLNESIAALTLVRDELIKTKASVEQDYASMSKLRQLKDLLGSI